MTKIVASGAQRQQIFWEIDVSIQQEVSNEQGNEKKITLGKKRKKGKKRQAKMREAGSKRIVTRRDGLVWIIPLEVPEDITWRREKSRRELLRRWEAPPLGPPGKTAKRWKFPSRGPPGAEGAEKRVKSKEINPSKSPTRRWIRSKDGY